MAELVRHRRSVPHLAGAVAAGLVLFLAAGWALLAAAVMLVVGLTDPDGFLTNLPAVATFLFLVGSAVMMATFALRLMREPGRRH